jgi:hypothetical protein
VPNGYGPGGDETRLGFRPQCEFCGEPAEFDFATGHGWSYGCPTHYEEHRAHLGLGPHTAQRIVVAEDDEPRPDTVRLDDPSSAARERRARAARRFRPDVVKTLLVAEAPPSASDRYFYFTDVRTQDSLFRYVTRVALGLEPTRENKGELLNALMQRGFFLIDLSPDPVGTRTLTEQVPELVTRCRNLDPRRIILIKATVYDAAFAALRRAGLPVVDVRIPFPGSGQQRRFEAAFRRALEISHD